MAEHSHIGWTDHTMNFWWGCHKIAPECARCYIGPIMRRAGREPFAGPIPTKDWSKPRKWDRHAAQIGRRLKIFTCSMSDFFHPEADTLRPAAWEVIRASPNLDWLILTKRPELVADRLPADWGQGFPNVWLGVTAGHPASLWRVSCLKQLPARLRFISAEPLLGPLDLRPHLDGSIHWVITGCEQAGKHRRRAMDLQWVRDIDRQCQKAGIPHFFKQYYDGNQIRFDGMLHGCVRQTWPPPPDIITPLETA